MEILARVKPKYFAAIHLFAANNDIRYYLNGVRIEPHPEQGAIIVATNGHIMAVVHDPDGYCAEPMIVGDVSKQLISACTSRGKTMPPTGLYIGSGGAVVAMGELKSGDIEPFGGGVTFVSRISIVDGKYPDWRKVLPARREPSTDFPHVAAKYLAIFEKAVKVFGVVKTYTGIRFESRGPELSMIARIMDFELTERFAAVVMPLRSDGPTQDILPVWLMPKEEPQADQANA